MPATLRAVWRWFGDLNDARRYVRTTEPETGPMGTGLAWRVHSRAEHFSYADILAWSDTCGLFPQPWQLAALTMIDDLFVRSINDPKSVEVPALRATGANLLGFFRAFMKKKT